MATYAQRLAAVVKLNTAGLGLIARTSTHEDVIEVKDPDHVIGAAGGVTPITGEISTNTWVRFSGVEAATAYGL